MVSTNELASYIYFGSLLLLGIFILVFIILIAVYLVFTRREVSIPLPVMDRVGTTLNRIRQLINVIGTILSLIIKGAFAIVYVIIVILALLYLILAAYYILTMIIGQIHLPR